MIDDEVLSAISVILVAAGIFILTQVFVTSKVEPFSEIAILGLKMKIGDYPKTIVVNETFDLYLYVSNHEGKSMYYFIYAKLGDKNTFINDTTPAEAPIIAKYELIMPNGMNCTIPISLCIPNPMMNARLIFEMWVLDESTLKPKYHNRWLQLWMNVTRPS